MIGKEILNYRIERLIGKGGMGSVYLAANKDIDQKVAIKVLNGNLADSQIVRDKFKNEASLLCSLDHPHIVKFLNYVENEDGIFLIMEYVDGITLEDFINHKNGLIVEARAYRMMEQILDAFAYAHRRKVIHRDIKPANIILTGDSDGEFQIKILDFGIARILSESNEQEKSWIVGTPSYMSPEQVKGADTDERSDIYSLGVLLYQMLTGRVPYDTTTLSDIDIQNRVVNDPLPVMREFYPYISAKMQYIVNRATAKNPDRRFQTCSEFRRAWKKALNPDPVHPVVKYGVAALVAVLLGCGWWYWDYHHTKISYYKDYVEQWGVPQGIHKLSTSEFRHRLSSYRFERRKGKTVRISHVNSKGKMIDHSDSEHTERIRDALFFYNDNGKVDYVKYRDKNGKVLFKKDYDENLKTVIFKYDDEFGAEMNLAASTTTLFANSFDNSSAEKGKISRYLLTYDDNGYLIRLRYAGFQNVPVSDKEGLYGKEFVVDEKGRVIEERYLGYDNSPKSNKAGLAIKKFEFDRKDDWVKVTYHAANGEFGSDGNGCSVVIIDNDKYGNRIRETYFDGEGNPALRKDCQLAGFSYLIDGNSGYRIQLTALGLDGLPCYDSRSGYSSTKYEYDVNGYVCKVTYLDTEGNLTPARGSGNAGMIIKNDANNNILELQYFDTEGQPCEIIDRYFSKFIAEHDSSGNMTSIFFYGTNDSLCLSNEGIAGWRIEYNDRNQATKYTYYGTNHQPCEDNNGVFVYKNEYDVNGNRIQISFYDGSGEKPKLSNQGIAGWKSVYENGNETQRTFFDEKGNPTAGNLGYAKWTATYDDNGNLLKIRYFDAKNNLTSVQLWTGVEYNYKRAAGQDYQYDDRGNETEIALVGQDGSYLSGHFIVRKEYDRYDNGTVISFYDYNGTRAVDPSSGYHKRERVYDSRNQVLEERYFGKDNRLTGVNGSKVAVFKYEYDNRGNTIILSYFDTSEKPVAGNKGYATEKNEYDAMGRLIRQTYFDENGAPTRPSVFVPEELTGYDKWGNKNYIAAADGHGNLIYNPKTGCAITRSEYDIKGNRLAESYFDSDSRPVLHKDHDAHLVKWEYDRQGNKTEIRYYGVDSTLRKNGYAIERYRYDAQGRETEVACFDHSDKAVEYSAGWHKCIQDYDAQGNPQYRKCYTAANKLQSTRKYDKQTGKWTEVTSEPALNWRDYWKKIIPACPVRQEGSDREISSVVLTANTCTVTIRFLNVSKYDISEATVESYKSELSEQVKTEKKNAGMPAGTRLIVIGVDKAKRELFRITN